MHTAPPKILLSCSREDFRPLRKTLEKWIKKSKASIGPDQPRDAAPQTFLNECLKAVAACDVMVHLAGRCGGDEPPPEILSQVLAAWDQSSPGFSARLGLKTGDRASYAQLEARLAYALGKTVHPIVLADDYAYGSVEPLADHSTKMLQHAHRAALQSLQPLESNSRTPFELNGAIQKLNLAGEDRRRHLGAKSKHPLIAAGMLTLAVASWFTWQKFGSAIMPLSVKPLALDLVEGTVLHDQPGIINTADQRFAASEAAVAERAGISVSTLDHALRNWALKIEADATSSDFDRALAAFIRKDYAKSEACALKAAPKDLEKEAERASSESRHSLMIAQYAQLARYKFADAHRLQFRQGYGPRQDLKSGRSEQRRHHDFYWLKSFIGSFMSGPGDGGWSVMMMQGGGANGAVADGYKLPPEDVLAIKGWLALAMSAKDKHEDAILMARSIVGDYERLHGRDYPSVRVGMENKASILLEYELFEEASNEISRLPQRLFKSEKDIVPDPTCSGSQLISSRMAHAMGQFDHAEMQARQVLEQRERLLEKDHPAIADALSQLALTLQACGKFVEAEKCQQRAVDIQEKCFGLRSLPATVCQRRLALIWKDLGKLQKANAALRECVRTQDQVLTDNQTERAETHAALSASDYDSGYIDDAIEHNLKAVELIQRLNGASSKRLAPIYLSLALEMNAADRDQEAWSYARQAQALFEESKNLNTPPLADTLDLIGKLQCASEKFTEAESYAQRAMRMHMTCHMRHPDYAMAMHSLAFIMRKNGRLQEAINMHQQAADLLKNVLPADHWMLGTSLKYQALALYEAGRYNEAEKLIEQARTILASTVGENHWRTGHVKETIAEWAREKDWRDLITKLGKGPELLEELERRREAERQKKQQQNQQAKPKPTA